MNSTMDLLSPKNLSYLKGLRPLPTEMILFSFSSYDFLGQQGIDAKGFHWSKTISV